MKLWEVLKLLSICNTGEFISEDGKYSIYSRNSGSINIKDLTNDKDDGEVLKITEKIRDIKWKVDHLIG